MIVGWAVSFHLCHPEPVEGQPLSRRFDILSVTV